MAGTDPSDTRGSSQLRVLVVDDNADVAESLCALLAALECITAVAFNGAQGLAAVQAFEPHLALIDLEMPDMSGCDLAMAIRAGHGQGSARLVCLTGRGHPGDRRLCLDAGFDEFFTKPLQPESLVALVAAAKVALRR